jgi:hypothetical protein
VDPLLTLVPTQTAQRVALTLATARLATAIFTICVCSSLSLELLAK